MVIDLSKLWNFNNPEYSEARFLAAIADAPDDDALILRTQIARTYGLRRDFERARQILSDIEPRIRTASTEAKVYYYLELGRSYASATHPPDSVTDNSKELARSAYSRAFELAQEGFLDGLAVDALHMMSFVDTAPEDQVEWNHKALAFMNASNQEAAKKWEGSLRNNLGYSLHTLGRLEEALQEFRLALAAREKEGNPGKVRIAYWMIAWTLRSLGKLDAALEIQLRLERECDDAGEPDEYVYEELEHLYRELNNDEQAEHYATKRRTFGEAA
jgi:tetratricopeptide (TPR) repeat protein